MMILIRYIMIKKYINIYLQNLFEGFQKESKIQSRLGRVNIGIKRSPGSPKIAIYFF